MKVLLVLLALVNTIWAAGGGQDLTTSWIGLVCLVIFVVGYYAVAAEEHYHINKAKPALFMGTFMFILIGIYYAANGMDATGLRSEVQHLILEISEIFFFFLVALTRFRRAVTQTQL